jgi:hypothetical protein
VFDLLYDEYAPMELLNKVSTSFELTHWDTKILGFTSWTWSSERSWTEFLFKLSKHIWAQGVIYVGYYLFVYICCWGCIVWYQNSSSLISSDGKSNATKGAFEQCLLSVAAFTAKTPNSLARLCLLLHCSVRKIQCKEEWKKLILWWNVIEFGQDFNPTV